MNYVSTRGYDRNYTSAEAIITGIAPDGGLFVPDSIPAITKDELAEMKNMQFYEISARVLSSILRISRKKSLLIIHVRHTARNGREPRSACSAEFIQ